MFVSVPRFLPLFLSACVARKKHTQKWWMPSRGIWNLSVFYFIRSPFVWLCIFCPIFSICNVYNVHFSYKLTKLHFKVCRNERKNYTRWVWCVSRTCTFSWWKKWIACKNPPVTAQLFFYFFLVWREKFNARTVQTNTSVCGNEIVAKLHIGHKNAI